MESTLHKTLKRIYGTDSGGSIEVAVKGYRIDAVDGQGNLIEIQSGSLGPLRGKLTKLLPDHRIRVIKPIGLRRRIVRRSRSGLRADRARLSPKRWELFDVFEDLVGIATIFPHPNLTIDVLAATIEEIRVPRRRYPGYSVEDRRLDGDHQSLVVHSATDLWSLIPLNWDWSIPFTTHDLARRLGRSLSCAQRITYCLRCSGAAHVVGKVRNSLVYRRPESIASHAAIN